MLPGIRWGISIGRINRTALLATVQSSKTRYSTYLTNPVGGAVRRPWPLELGHTFWAAVGGAANASTEKAKLAAVVSAKVKPNSHKRLGKLPLDDLDEKAALIYHLLNFRRRSVRHGQNRIATEGLISATPPLSSSLSKE